MCIAFLVAVTLSCTPAAVFQHSTKEHRIANIGLGINLAVVLVGASIPMVVTILSQYSQAYVGLLLSFGGTAYFASMALDKYIQNQPQRVQTA